MKIHAMRHGETPANAEKKIQGHCLDLGLNESGKDQVRKALEQLPAGITMIISSPLKRARESAEIVAAYLHLPITFLDELKEKDVGNLSGKTWDEASELSGRNLREEEREGTLGFQEFGGESLEQIKTRLLKALRGIKDRHPHEKILLVTHAGIINLMHKLFSEKKEVILPNASIHEFDIDSVETILMELNQS